MDLEAKCRELGPHDMEADVTRVAERCRGSKDRDLCWRFADLARAGVRVALAARCARGGRGRQREGRGKEAHEPEADARLVPAARLAATLQHVSWPAPVEASARRYAPRHALQHRVEARAWTDAWRVAADGPGHFTRHDTKHACVVCSVGSKIRIHRQIRPTSAGVFQIAAPSHCYDRCA